MKPASRHIYFQQSTFKQKILPIHSEIAAVTWTAIPYAYLIIRGRGNNCIIQIK